VSACDEISTISGEELQIVNKASSILSAFSQEGNILSFHYGTGKFLSDFLMIITTANLFITFFTDCKPPEIQRMM
jgi:hypothetical protein